MPTIKYSDICNVPLSILSRTVHHQQIEFKQISQSGVQE